MKKRIKIDTLILVTIIVLTVALSFYFKLHTKSLWLDSFLSFLGMMVILKGALLRMAAGGHKKAFSSQGGELVTTGPYQLTRNPMYLGTFLVGAGFVLILWPWWGLLIYAWIFYQRFNRQMIIEERHLSKLFGQGYQTYCQKVPRIFPDVRKWTKVKMYKMFNLQEAFSTKEKFLLVACPTIAILLKTFQQWVVFGYVNLPLTLVVFAGAILAFGLGFTIEYQRR